MIEHLPLIFLPQRTEFITSLQLFWVLPGFSPLSPLEGSSGDRREEWHRRQASWNNAWYNIASLRRLRTLEVTLEVVSLYWQSINEQNIRIILEPVRQVTRPESFVLKLPFSAMGGQRPALNFSWSAVNDWHGADPWDELPCTIQRI